MNVSDIITQVAQLGLNEDYPDTALAERILSYVNRAHEQTYSEVGQYLEPVNSQTQTVAITAGQGTLSPEPDFFISVVDTTSSRKLQATTASTLEDTDPALDAVGNPTYYYKVGTTIYTYPINSTSLRVRYIPIKTELTAATTEAELPYPTKYHSVLVWGALYWMSLDERDLTTNTVLMSASGNYKQLIQKMASYLQGNGRNAFTVTGYDF